MIKLCALILVLFFFEESLCKRRRSSDAIIYFGPHNKPIYRRRQNNALRIRKEDPMAIAKRRVKGNNSIDTRSAPYMAAIIINGRLWCAGALVDANWVLTAAHCLNYVLLVSPLKSINKYVKVRLGSARAHEGGELLGVVGAVRHPKFEEEPVPHGDVALLKLSKNVLMSNYINIIKIYQGMQLPYAQSFIAVSGWGQTRGSDLGFRQHTPNLMQARLKVRTHHYCQEAYQLVNGLQITNDFFCASLRNGTRDVCLFDAGAPAIQQNRLMGIMSFGPEYCGHEYQPAVFIRAFFLRDFVKSTISSYKSTNEMIEAMQEADTDIRVPTFGQKGNDDETPALGANAGLGDQQIQKVDNAIDL